MDWNRVEGNWKQMKGKVKEQWGKLTDDDLDVVAGKRDQLEGRIQERYGYEKDRVKKEDDDWYSSPKWCPRFCDSNPTPGPPPGALFLRLSSPRVSPGAA